MAEKQEKGKSGQDREHKMFEQLEEISHKIDDALEPLSVLHQFFRTDEDPFEIESSAFFEISTMIDRAYRNVKAAFDIFEERA